MALSNRMSLGSPSNCAALQRKPSNCCGNGCARPAAPNMAFALARLRALPKTAEPPAIVSGDGIKNVKIHLMMRDAPVVSI